MAKEKEDFKKALQDLFGVDLKDLRIVIRNNQMDFQGSVKIKVDDKVKKA